MNSLNLESIDQKEIDNLSIELCNILTSPAKLLVLAELLSQAKERVYVKILENSVEKNGLITIVKPNEKST